MNEYILHIYTYVHVCETTILSYITKQNRKKEFPHCSLKSHNADVFLNFHLSIYFYLSFFLRVTYKSTVFKSFPPLSYLLPVPPTATPSQVHGLFLFSH